jgi:hypothetical protein
MMDLNEIECKIMAIYNTIEEDPLWWLPIDDRWKWRAGAKFMCKRILSELMEGSIEDIITKTDFSYEIIGHTCQCNTCKCMDEDI